MLLIDCGTEAEEGWEMVQRTNKTKFRLSPSNGSLSKTTVPARQADSDGRTVSLTRHKEGSCRANVTASKQTHVAVADIKKQQCSVLAVNINSNSSNVTKHLINPSQQFKSSSHISCSRGNSGTKSSSRVPPLISTAGRLCPDTLQSEKCLKTAETCMTETSRGTGSELNENGRTEQGNSRLNAGGAECDVHSSVCISGAESHHSTVTQAGIGSSNKPPVSITTVSATHSVSSKLSSSMTEVRCSESADIQQSSSDSDRLSFHLCRKSVSDDTLVERVTVSGDNLTDNCHVSVVSCILRHLN